MSKEKYESNFKRLNEKEIIDLIVNAIKYEEKTNIINVVNPIENTDVLAGLKPYVAKNYKGAKIVFNVEVDFKEGTVYMPMNLSEIEFLKRVSFTNCLVKQNFTCKDCIFHSEVNFSDSIFMGKTRYHFSEFKKSVNFKNTTFNNLVDFYQVKFFDLQQFWLTDFLNVAIFSESEFKEQVQFLHNKISQAETYISFEGTKFQKSLDISRSNFRSTVQFWKCKIGEVVPEDLWMFARDSIEKKDLNHNEYLQALSRLRESYRRIKQEFRDGHNHIASLEFKNYEMQVYTKEVEKDTSKGINDKLILFFNRISNQYGSSWVEGFKFTMICTSIVFIISLLILRASNLIEPADSFNDFGVTLKLFVQILNIANWNIETLGANKCPWFYVILFIGRIFIGYGYYQTIYAFRKFK